MALSRGLDSLGTRQVDPPLPREDRRFIEELGSLAKRTLDGIRREMALPKARRVYLTEVDAVVEGDVTFPTFDESMYSSRLLACRKYPKRLSASPSPYHGDTS